MRDQRIGQTTPVYGSNGIGQRLLGEGVAGMEGDGERLQAGVGT